MIYAAKSKQEAEGGCERGRLRRAVHLGEMLCAPFVPSNKPGSVTAPGAGGRRGRKENCLSSMCECHKACIEGGGRTEMVLSVLGNLPEQVRGALELSLLAEGFVYGA